jgi:predicted NBD/HSP70 family sugar kinase
MIFLPASMGLMNKRALLRRLQRTGLASRASLAKALGMSQPTSGKIVDELLAAGVLEEIEVADSSSSRLRGRPGRMLRLNQSKPRLIAIQLGLQETAVSGLALGVSGPDAWQVTFSVAKSEPDPAAAWEKQLHTAAKKIGGKNFLGVLLSVPGIVDENANRILFSPNVHWAEKVDLAAIVARVWKVPVLLVQEQRALALGYHLAHPSNDDFLLVDFGEGIGGTVIMGGKPLAHPLPISGEIGHTPVLGNRRRCGCGAVGCMETLVSQRGLLESFSAAQRGRKCAWADLPAYIARNGIPAWLAQSLDAAAMAIAGSLNVLGLRRVVITGSLTELPGTVIAHLGQAIENGSMWAKFGSVECVAAPRRRLSGLVAIGIDQLIVPDNRKKKLQTGKMPGPETGRRF